MTTSSLIKLIHSSRWLSLLMLALLHGALWVGVDSIWSRPLLLSHFGLFLLWQPLWRGEQNLRTGSTVFIICASVIAIWWLSWWVLTFWVSSLFALVGGRVFTFQAKWQRFRYLLAMVYLLSALLLWVAPQLFALPIDEATRSLMGVALPLLLAGMALLPKEEHVQSDATPIVDFIYSLLLFMLLTLLMLGSLAFMTLGRVDYPGALLRTLFIMALLLFVLGWLWNSRPIFPGSQLGFSGLQPLFSRYLLNIGSPFEVWLKQLAESAQQEPDPDAFLARATEHLAALHWLSGLTWTAASSQGKLGVASPHPIQVVENDLHITLFSRQPVAPSVLLHIHFLTRLLGHFYQAKQHEVRLREMARLQAIYETGSRLTHDLKNMLQSLLALTSAAQRRGEEALPLMRTQLPLLTQRIEVALSKLKTPQANEEISTLPMHAWWTTLRQRYQHEPIEWISEATADSAEEPIPATMFDCVADNLIDNARIKRLSQTSILIRVTLRTHPLSLAVCDSGYAIPAPLAHQILHSLVPSATGLGVGLYQAARWAQQHNFEIVLRQNSDGAVCFELIFCGNSV